MRAVATRPDRFPCRPPSVPGAAPKAMSRLKRAFIWLLCGLIGLQAFAQSTLLQEPPFTPVDPAPNVMVMFDDSGSMGGHRLPGPGWTPSYGAGARVTIEGLGPDSANAWAMRSWSIDANDDFLLRAPAFNPLWYNPAVRYLPWNKDGTYLPNASVGGAVPNTNYGAGGARANPSLITERDPRQVPTGVNTYASVTPVAGRGLLGTDPYAPTSDTSVGRLVTGFSPSVAFRYHKMPFDFGPPPPGDPEEAHANMAWTTHDDVESPLDLFSRPVVNTNLPEVCTTRTVTRTGNRTGCFSSAAVCQANQPAAPTIDTTTWSRQNCDGSTSSFASDPGPLTCWRSRCPSGTNSTWSAWQPGSAPTPVCDWQRANCDGSVTTSAGNPGTLSCPWRRPGCDGTYGGLGAVNSSATNPGTLTCWQTRACTSPMGGFGAWQTTDPGPGTACYERQDCAGAIGVFVGNPGTLSCPATRENCAGTVENFPSDPGPLTCWSRNTCSGAAQTFTSDPGALGCGWTRQNCQGVTETFGGDPGSLTCYSRRNCDGSTTGPTASPLVPVTCQRGDEAPVVQQPTTWTQTAQRQTNNPWTFTRNPSGGAVRWPWSVPTVQSVTRSAVAPDTFSPTRLSPEVQSQTNTATPVTVSSCPAGTAWQSCTASWQEQETTCTPGPPVTVPNPAALTPARHYAYAGTGSRSDPANYRVVQIDRTRPSTMLFPVIDAITGVAATADSSQRTDCAARTACTWPEEAQNFANWFLYYRNRMFAAQAVMFDALSSLRSPTQQQFRLGFGRINHTNGAVDGWRTETGAAVATPPSIDGIANPGALVRGVRSFVVGSPERGQFFQWLHSLAWTGATPNREALDAVGRYFTRTDDAGPWGAMPGTANTTAHLACRRNYTLLTTDGDWTSFTTGQPLISASGPLGGPGTPVDAASRDGPALAGSGPNAAATFTYRPGDWPQYTGGSLGTGTLTDVATYYWNRDLRPDLPNVIGPILDPNRPNPAFWQSMSTFVVGYGLTASMDTAATRAAILTGQPVAWPTVDTSPTVASGGNRVNDSFRAAMASRGNFYAATSLPELRAGILSAFEQLQIRQGSAGGVAVTGPTVTADSLAFFPSYVTGVWSGTLRAFSSANLQSLAGGSDPTPAWTATTPAPANRRILTSTASAAAADFLLPQLSATQQSQLAGANWTAAEFVDWLRGDTTLEQGVPIVPGTKFRRRGGPFGDFVNSAPLYVRAPDYAYHGLPGIGPSYAAHVAGRRAAGPGTVFIGGNGGMLHAFDASTGVERFAYVPRAVYPHLAALGDPTYRHRYYVDGQVTPGDFHDGTRWRSAVVGTTGAGGTSLFAVDTTDASAVTRSSVLWDLTQAEHPDIGHIMGRGVIGRVRTGSGANDFRWVYINGNGYESRDHRAALLVVDLLTGGVTSIPVGPAWTAADGPAARNGLGPPTVRYDGQRNILGVYAGDKQGNLWRFDFSSRIPTAASGFDGPGTPLFTAVDAGGARQPITSAPRLANHPLGGLFVVFGTGTLLDEGDPTSTAAQGLYAIWEKPMHMATITRAQLAQVTVATDASGNRGFDLAGIDWSTRLGWRLDTTGGERVVASPSLELGLLSVSTFLPQAIVDPCEGGGQSNVYRIDLIGGRVDVASAPGMVGSVTPVLAMNVPTRNKASADLSAAMRGIPAPGGAGAPVPTQCTLYGSAIQGRPSVIARACPTFSPIRAWRQPLR